jgi:hypothetical protein
MDHPTISTPKTRSGKNTHSKLIIDPNINQLHASDVFKPSYQL